MEIGDTSISDEARHRLDGPQQTRTDASTEIAAAERRRPEGADNRQIGETRQTARWNERPPAR